MRGFYFGAKPEADMSIIGSLGLDSPQRPSVGERPMAMFSEAQVLGRIFEFTGYTINDVINDPLARNAVRGYYELYRFVERRCEEIAMSSLHS